MRIKLWVRSISFFLFFQYTKCCENLTCFVDYVETLSCILRNDLGASSYSLTATWIQEEDPENPVATCSLLQLSRNTSHTQYACTVDMTEILADIKVQVDVTERADRQHMISKSFYMAENKVPEGFCNGHLNQQDIAVVTQGVPDAMEIELLLLGAIPSHPSLLYDRETECNHVVDLVGGWRILSCAAIYEEKRCLAWQSVKPQPPFNLTAVFSEGYNISWETIYQNAPFYFLNEELEYQLRYKRRTDTWETQKTKAIREDKRTLVILPLELQANTEYEFQVRARPREDTVYSGFWSEWSSPLTLKTSPAAVTETAGMRWLLLSGVVLAITASVITFLAKQQRLWKKIEGCIPDPASFFKPLYLVHNGDFKKWVGASHKQVTLDFFEWGVVLPEVLEVYAMHPSKSISREELRELRQDLPCKPCVSCLTAPGQHSQSLLSSVNSISGTGDQSYGHLSIDTVTVADEFTPCNCQCTCNRVHREHDHSSEEDSGTGETGYPKVNVDDEDGKTSSDLHLADLSTQDKILASGSVSMEPLRSSSVPAHQQVERAFEGGMRSILEALCLQPWDLENPGSLPSPDGESVSYSEGSCDFFPHIARPGDIYPMICVDLDTIDSGFVDSDCGSPVDCEFEQNSQTNCGPILLEQEGEDFPRSYVKQWVSCRSDGPANGTQTN